MITREKLNQFALILLLISALILFIFGYFVTKFTWVSIIRTIFSTLFYICLYFLIISYLVKITISWNDFFRSLVIVFVVVIVSYLSTFLMYLGFISIMGTAIPATILGLWQIPLKGLSALHFGRYIVPIIFTFIFMRNPIIGATIIYTLLTFMIIKLVRFIKRKINR